MPYVSVDNASQLRDLFRNFDRHCTFSHNGFEWLYDYIEECEDASGEPYTIDVVGLCCDFSEDAYETVASEYRIDLPSRDDFMETDDEGDPLPDTFDSDVYDEAVRETVIDYLNEHTAVCGYDDDSVLFAQF